MLADDPCDLRTHGHTRLGLWLPPSSIHPNLKTCDNLQRQQEKERDALQLCFQSDLGLWVFIVKYSAYILGVL